MVIAFEDNFSAPLAEKATDVCNASDSKYFFSCRNGATLKLAEGCWNGMILLLEQAMSC